MDEQARRGGGVPSREAWVNALGGPSELRELIRAHDWASTPVGPMASWPHGLKVLIKMMLASRYPHDPHVGAAPLQGARAEGEARAGRDAS